MGFWPVVKKVVKDSDLVLLVMDARMPELSENKALLGMVRVHRKKVIPVFTKIDLVSEKYLGVLRKEHRNAFFVSGTKNIGISKLKTGLLILAKRAGIAEPFVGIVGYPNVGKSAVINALAKRAKAKVSGRAGTTKGIQWVKAGTLKILDSPGVVPYKDNEVELGILGAKNADKLRDVEKVVFHLLKMFLESSRSNLEKFFGIDTKGKDEYDVLLDIGRSKGFLRGGNRVDEHRAASYILKVWQKGDLRL
tara:strand:- start:4682 stop:5431 length:750 start_codon:yes stop_codon:yes gene_type:complete